MKPAILRFLNWFADSDHYAVAAPVILAIFIALTAGWGLFQSFEFETLDLRIQALADAEPEVHPALVFVGIGNTSIEELGRWPWPRSKHAQFFEEISKHPPRAIAYDILFADLGEPAEDEALADVAVNVELGGRIAFAAHLDKERHREHLPSSDSAAQGLNRTEYGFTFPFENIKGEPGPGFDSIYAADLPILPYQLLAESSLIGFVDCVPDADGVRRRVPLVVGVGDEFYPSLTTQALMLYWELVAEDVEVVFGEHLTFHRPEGDVVVPISDRGELILNWRRLRTADWTGMGYEAWEFASLSVEPQSPANVAKRITALENLEDKIVVVGQNSTGLSDNGVTPLDPLTPLPMVHVNAINSILTGDFIHVARFWPSLLAWLAVAFSSCWWLRKRAIAWAVAIPIGLIAFYIGFSILIYVSQRWVIPVVWPVLFFAVLHIGAGAIRWLRELQLRLEIRSVFASYVSGPLLEHLLEHPNAVALDGEVLPVTVFFSDIRGFTTISESMEAPKLVEKLNHYFTEMVACVHQHKGTMHKYIGDAIMAVWGDILDQSEEKSANEAVSAALEMRERLARLNKEWRAKGEAEFRIGIGINHGEVRVGHIGAPDRREFTVIGDVVNVASRIEGLTKVFQTDFLIGDNVENLLDESIIRRPVGLITVKGKTKPIKVFEVLDRRTPETEELAAWADRFGKAFDLFLSREFSAASKLFEECFAERKGDPIAKNYIDSCRDLVKHPPGEDWRGVIVMKSK